MRSEIKGQREISNWYTKERISVRQSSEKECGCVRPRYVHKNTSIYGAICTRTYRVSFEV